MRLKVGMIGCGRIASTIDDERTSQWRGGVVLPLAHAGGYAQATDVTEMVAACDVDEAKLAEFQRRWNVPRGYADFRELIDAERPDILSICTRPEQHAEAMVYGAEHGVQGMFAEKPLCCTLREADAIREAFERASVMLEFGPPRRNWTVYQQARAIAASGEFGRVQRVIGFWGNSVGGHGLDTVLYLAGDPEEITSIRGTLDELSPAPGDTSHMHFIKDTPIRSALIEFADGPDIAVVGTGNLEFEVVCEGGLIRVRNDGEEMEVRRKDTRSGFDPVPTEPVEHWCGTERKIRDLVQAIRTGRPTVSNLRIAMLSTEIGFGLYESHLRGGTAVRPPIPNRDRIVSSW